MANATEVRNQMSTSNFLKGNDLGHGAEVKVTVSEVEEGRQKNRNGKEVPQLMLHFEGKEKKLGLNVGNLDTMISMFGANTDDWVGQEITLFTLPAQTPDGKMTLGVRIKGTVIQTGEPVNTEF